MNTAAYTPSSGLEHHACISSTTASVIREIVSLQIEAPYTSAKCAEISPVVNPFAYNEIATASTSDRRRCRFATITGSNVPARSRGTLNVDLPRGVGQDRLGPGAVADVPARTTRRRVVLLMAQVLGHPLLQRRLQHRGGDRLEQPVRAGQVLTAGTSRLDQLPHRRPLHS